MNGAAIKTFVDALTQDSAGDTWFYNALNIAKDRYEGKYNFEWLKKLDESLTHSAGSTVATAHALPTLFRRPLKLFVGTESDPRLPIRLEDKRIYRDTSGFFLIDWIAGTYSLTGTEATGGTLYNLYIAQTPDITSSTSPYGPALYHRVLAYDVAKQWFLQDQGEREFSWTNEMATEAKSALDALIYEDEQMKAAQANADPSTSVYAGMNA